MNLDIVIPCYNALPCLKECLRTLDEAYPSRNLILVDDQSEEETKIFIRTYSSDRANTSVIWREHRGWFTRAMNTGIRFSMTRLAIPWLICLNSDCVIGVGAFEEMEEVWHIAEKELGKPVGMVGNGAATGFETLSNPRWVNVIEPAGVPGHCILFKKQLMKEHSFRFPQSPSEVLPGNNLGLTAQALVHFNSDGLLSFWMNRKGFVTVKNCYILVGHHGNMSGTDGAYSQNTALLRD